MHARWPARATKALLVGAVLSLMTCRLQGRHSRQLQRRLHLPVSCGVLSQVPAKDLHSVARRSGKPAGEAREGDRPGALPRGVQHRPLEQRRTWWEHGQGKGATYYQQKAELPAFTSRCRAYAESTPRRCKMCCCVWSAPITRPFSAACSRARRRGFRAFRGGVAATSSTIPRAASRGSPCGATSTRSRTR